MKKQVIVVAGGDSFDTYEDYLKFLESFEIESLDDLKGKRWKDSLPEKLGSDFDVTVLRMPNSFNCKYLEWKIWFDKIVKLLNDGVVLVGHSQGGIFLMKYLAENTISKNIASLHIVAAPFDTEDSDGWTLADFVLPENLDNVSNQVKEIYFYQSKDDSIVVFNHLEKYKKHFPNSKEFIFEDRGHFSQTEFPELVENIKTS